MKDRKPPVNAAEANPLYQVKPFEPVKKEDCIQLLKQRLKINGAPVISQQVQPKRQRQNVINSLVKAITNVEKSDKSLFTESSSSDLERQELNCSDSSLALEDEEKEALTE